jgi:hypothetical protein
MILGVGAYLTYLSNRPDEIVTAPTVQTTETKTQAAPQITNILETKADVEYLTLLPEPKCQTPAEQYFCTGINRSDSSFEGVIIKEKTVFMIIDASLYYKKAKSFLPPPPKAETTEPEPVDTEGEPEAPSLEDLSVEAPTTPDQKPTIVASEVLSPTAHLTAFQRVEYEQDLAKVTAGLFIIEGFKRSFDLEKLPKDTEIHIGLIHQVSNKPQVLVGISVTPMGLIAARVLVNYKKLTPNEKTQKLVLDFTKELYNLSYGNYVPE